MKTAIFTSVLLSSLALSAPLDKRVAATYWQTDVVTVVATKTVNGNQPTTTEPSSTQPTLVQPTTQSTLAQSTTQPVISSASVANAAAVPTTASTKALSVASSTSVPAATSSSPTSVNAAAAGTGSIYQSQAGARAVATLAPLVAPSVGQSFSGDGTVYNGVGDPGACGLGPLEDADLFVAVPHGMIGEAGAYNQGLLEPESPWCGVTVQVSYQGKTALAPVKDRCGGCKVGDIDTSPALFSYLTNGQTTGRLPFQWSIVAKSPYY